MRALRHARVSSPIGTLLLLGDDERLHELRLPPVDGDHDVDNDERLRELHLPPTARDHDVDDSLGVGELADAAPLAAARAQLAAYFAGELRAFELPLALDGSPFFVQVWHAVCAIPFGETRTYGEVAARLGRPRAARAVGLANGRNPFPIVVPCHRLIGADGSLTGYGGGLDRKRWLLDHEARLVADA